MVMVIMARVLTPADYGLVGMLAIFTAVAQSLADSGFSQALIRLQDRTERDNSTVFYFNVVVAIALYFTLYFCAPLIAEFYGEPLLIPLTRVISLTVVFNSLVVVQRALLTVNIDFRTQTWATLTGALFSGAIGIYMAYTGWGVWAIAIQAVTNIGVAAGMLWLLTQWRPRWEYSWQSFRRLFGFGSKLAVSGIIETLYRNAYLIVIGKVFRAADLGQYTRASQFAEFPSTNLTGIVQRVSYPLLCAVAQDRQRLLHDYARQLRLAAFAIFPVMMLIAGASTPLISSLLNPQWLPAAEMLTILCLGMMWYPVNSLNLNLLMVLGRSDMFLRAEVWKKVIGALLLCGSVPLGVMAMCASLALASIAALGVNAHYVSKATGLTFGWEMRSLAPALAYAFAAFAAARAVAMCQFNSWVVMCLSLGAGALIFILLASLTHSQELKEIKGILKR